MPVGNQTAMLSKLQAVNARFFLNNATAKIHSHLDRVASNAAERLRVLLGEDSIEAAVWTEIWDAAVQHKSIDEERGANKQLLRCLRLVWEMDFNIQLLLLGLQHSLGQPTDSVRAILEEIIAKIGRRAVEMNDRSTASRNSSAAMLAFAKMAAEVHVRLITTLSRWDRLKGRRAGSPRSISEEVERQRSLAASLFAEIDNQYRERNRLTEIERFDSILVMRVNSSPGEGASLKTMRSNLVRGLTRELQSYVTRTNGQAKPRIYRGNAGLSGSENLVHVRTNTTETFFEIRMAAHGSSIAGWYGYIVGKFLGYDNYGAIGVRPSWISIVGLDETRRYSRASDTDEIVGAPLIDQLIIEELASGAHEGRLISAGTEVARAIACKAFQEEYSAVRKSKGATRFAETDIGVDALGGTATVCSYGVDSSEAYRSARDSKNHEAAVLVLATEWSSHHGGLSTFNRMLCRAIGELGVKVACAVQEASAVDIEDARRHKVQLIVSPADPGAPPISGLYRSFQLPLGFQPTVVIGHGRITGHAAKAQVFDRFSAAQRVHFVHMAPGEIEWFKENDDTTKKAEEREDVERALSGTASLVAAVGDRLFAETESLLAGSGTPLLLFEPGLMDQSDAEPLQLDHCLLLGRAEDWKLKGIDIAAQAIGRLTKDQSFAGREVELVVRGAVAGTGDDLRRDLLSHCLGADVQIRIREFKAGDDAVQRDLKRASVVVMPSRREGFGLVALEAISAGVPVLVTDKSGIAAMIKRHVPRAVENVVVATAEDLATSSQRWAKAIEFVLRDKNASFRRARELRTDLGRTVSWTTSVETMMQRLLELRSSDREMPAITSPVEALGSSGDGVAV